jgi:hypothetical protein
MQRLICLAALWAVFSCPVQAHDHPPEHAQLHDQFYKTWERPDWPGFSCCNDKDCGPAEAKMVDGVWFARHVNGTRWYKIPPQKVEYNRDSPDGRNHLCAIGEQVYCFIAGSGS